MSLKYFIILIAFYYSALHVYETHTKCITVNSSLNVCTCITDEKPEEVNVVPDWEVKL